MEPTAKVELEENKPSVSSANVVSYPLIAAFDPQLKFNILKFAPSSNRRIDLSTFVEPVKLNRKDPWAIRKKAEEEKKKTVESKNPAQDSTVKTEGDHIQNENHVDIKPDPSESNKPSTQTSTSTSTATSKPTRDESMIAPAPASQPKLKVQPFKKKTKQIFIASDQAARMLKKEEYQSWLLEDGSTNGERWIGRYESAGATSGSSSNSNSTTTNNDASNYVLFRLDGSGQDFQVIPCHRFYRFTQRPSYDTLGAEEAEAAYEKMQKPTTKEDVGRWFMRRRGINSSSSQSTTPASDNKASINQSIKSEENHKKISSSSSKIGFFDHSKLPFGNQNHMKNQVEIPNFINGRRNKFTAVQGSNPSNMDEDEDKKPNFGQEGDFDEVDYEAEFDDDEEGAGNLNDEAMEEDEVKELADKMKREMLAAGKAGDDERNREQIDLENDPLFGERADLTKEGKAVKKLLMRKSEDNGYGSDDDVRNPYASEDDESDLEEVLPPINVNVASPIEGNQPSSRSGTPAPGSQSNNNSSIGSRNVNKLTGSQSAALKNERPLSRPPSRSGTPVLPGDGRMNPSSHSAVVAPGFTTGAVNRSRGSSPQILPPSRAPHSLPVLPPFLKPSPSSSPTNLNTNGKRKQHPMGVIPTLGKKINSGPGPDNYSTEPSSTSSSSTHHNPTSHPPRQRAMTIQHRDQMVQLLRGGDMSTKELLSHFKFLAIRDERDRLELGAFIRTIAHLVNGRWYLKENL